MTSANVSKMTSNMPFQTNASAKTGKEEQQDNADFMGMLGNLAVTYQIAQNGNTENYQTVKEDRVQSKTEYEKYPVREDRIPEATGPDEAKMQEAQENLEEFTDGVKEKLEETFGVSEEQVEAVMDELGLTFADLLNPANLAELVTKLTGGEDSLGLLMNENFQELMQDVEVLGEEFLQKLGMSAKEASALLDQIQQNIPQASKEAVTQQVQDQNAEAAPMQQPKQQEEIPGEDLSLQMSETDEPVKDIQQRPEQAAESVPEEVSEEVKAAVRTENGGEMSQEESEEGEPQLAEKENVPAEHKTEWKESGNSNFAEHTVNVVHTAETVDRIITDVNMTPQSSTVDVVNIIRQVSEFTRIMYQGNITSMEMQLNPENLGKIFVQISAKEGIITARIAAQNEAVKEVLESQTAMLKENMSQQGLKVEAVEVTIASHEFERNLEENQHNQSQEEQKEQSKENGRNTRRSLSLNQLDELSGLMSEEEILAAKIMRDNGNSVDFTA